MHDVNVDEDIETEGNPDNNQIVEVVTDTTNDEGQVENSEEEFEQPSLWNAPGTVQCMRNFFSFNTVGQSYKLLFGDIRQCKVRGMFKKTISGIVSHNRL